jgi:hypothetical protein
MGQRCRILLEPAGRGDGCIGIVSSPITGCFKRILTAPEVSSVISNEAEESPDGHHHREGHREEPERRGVELRAPEAHGHHGQDVVPSGR